MKIIAKHRFTKRYFWFAMIFSLAFHFLLFFELDWVSHVDSTPSPSVVVTKLIDIQEIQQLKNSIQSGPSGVDDSINQQSNMEERVDVGQAFKLPPSALLSYASYVNGNPNQITQINWVNLGDGYQIKVTLSVPFLGDYVFSSIGGIDQYGLSPDFYEEIRGSKGSRNIEFVRQANSIKYSVNGQSSDLPKGAQDRFSVLFQLACLVGGNSQLDDSGVAREIPVAELDKLSQWIFVSQGDEDVSDPTNDKKIKARHFVRLPRNEADQRKVEVWLAEDHHWLPLKIIQTEPNGRVFELFLIKRQDASPI
jgi:hypothetical protein